MFKFFRREQKNNKETNDAMLAEKNQNKGKRHRKANTKSAVRGSSEEIKAEKRRINRDNCIETVIWKTGWSREKTIEHIESARKRIGINYTQYKNCHMWEVPEPEQEMVYRQFLDKRKKRKEERKIEKEAADARKKIILESVHNDNCNEAASDLKNHLQNTKSFLPDGINKKVPVSFEDLRKIIGEELLPDTGKVRKDYDSFSNRFVSHRDIEKSSDIFLLLFLDWLFFSDDIGYDPDDYFDYEFYNKGKKERETFISARYRETLKRKLNKDPGILADKGRFLKYFEKFVRRAWLDCNNCSFEELEHFAKRHPVFFAKENGQGGGVGITKVDSSNMNANELYKEFGSKNLVLEEPIIQHPALAKFNPDTVNTIRIWTLADVLNDVHVMGAAIRFGRIGECVDNYHSGGVVAIIDEKTGEIISDAIDRNGKHYSKHPDSEEKFVGFLVPFWDEILSVAKEAANACIEKNRNIGWDIVLTSSEEVDLVEGNSRPGFDIMQAQNMKGRKDEYEKYVPELIKAADEMRL